MSDFIREVDEEYRRERVALFLRRFQVPLIILAVLIVAGAAGWRWMVDRQAAQTQAADVRYEAAGAQARDGNTVEAEENFTKLANDGPSGYVVLARLRKAEVQGLRDPAGAAQALDAISSDLGSGNPALRDLARYRGALLRIDIADPKGFDSQYGRFAQESFTFHDGMRELLALAALKRGDQTAAGHYLDDIVIDPLAPPALRSRAQAFRELVNAGAATPMATAPSPANVVPLAAPAGAEARAPLQRPAAPAASTPPPAPVAPPTPSAHQ